jgi:putative transposase
MIDEVRVPIATRHRVYSAFTAQTITQILLHLVFSTKNRVDLITPAIETDLYSYLGGITRNLKCPLIAAGGTPNHVHLLVVFGKTVTLADLLMHTKKDSSKWLKSKGIRNFSWQRATAVSHR